MTWRALLSLILGVNLQTAAALGVAVAGLGLSLWITALRADARDLRAENASLNQARMALQTELEATRKILATALEADRAARRRAEAATALKEEVRDAPETDDGPVAPVLADLLERMRRDVD